MEQADCGSMITTESRVLSVTSFDLSHALSADLFWHHACSPRRRDAPEDIPVRHFANEVSKTLE
jgi:hypothetical protein